MYCHVSLINDLFMNPLRIKRVEALVFQSQIYSQRSFRSLSHCRLFATAIEQSSDVYDVVCIGGGLVGLTLLTSLRTVLQLNL